MSDASATGTVADDRDPARSRRGQRRAGLVLVTTGLLALLLTGGIVAALADLVLDGGRGIAADDDAPDAATSDTAATARTALATAPMLDLPPAAAAPHALTTRTAGPPVALPAAAPGDPLATRFPATPEGALAQLAELMRVGMAGGDPAVWERTYDAVAEPGAAPAAGTWTGRDLVDLRRGAGMSVSGPPPEGTSISWTPTAAMVKGTLDGGTYTVACVLGELVVENRGRVVTAGWGNCLPMHRTGDRWLVAAGPTAALAPSAWPGSAEAVDAGWREIRR
ncbi:hypothetical protein [Pseudonocardia sp. ICBG1293]|uniref:hypothetical protein n=1 Tax=Pseudonocardia sp. ICBG1293 TaxID=2844382 RepID=UPI001CCF4BCB|nr:hypothetical protein [Pseudonocardia sp. ICBG1293]